MTPDVETVVVGAGVVGLAVARALCDAGQEVLVLEQHDLVGSQTSSRNSEVIHAGIYYPAGSVRARLCVRGKHLLYQFAADNGVGHARCGKLLVAVTADEIGKLHKLLANAAACGVDDLVPLSPADARALEPAVACTAAALSPSTGIVDSHGLMLALEGHITSAGGQIVLGAQVTGIDRAGDGLFAVTTSSAGEAGRITCRRLVNAAGLGASDVGCMIHAGCGGDPALVPQTWPAKGHYFALAGRSPFSRPVYPMPVAGGLGTHLTVDLAGRAKFGPDVTFYEDAPRHPPDYAFDDPEGRAARFYRDVRLFWPGLPDGALQPDYTGLRPRIYRKGAPAADFAIHDARIHGIAGYVGLYGIESPGLTAGLAIAEVVAEHLA